ncbi:murein biosynthesis integral membrane protein MurJ [Geobacillus sp. E263]|uniref:murein biosynthesis integral membrane protein MurJ n=1 Tax=Geobacillus sp. E263 TaxID=391290 RepID=UPI00117AC927|nr:murein biosynthesis integral membrane protein MurJ [Geobacillus sp. E263]
MSLREKVTKSAISIMLIIIFSKILGLFREILIAAKFGSNDETDAYFTAMTVSSIVIALILDTLNTTLIPIFSEIQVKYGKRRVNDYINNIINIVILFSIALILLNYLFSPYIIKLLASGFTGEKFDITVYLNRIGFPIILFMGLTIIYKSYLQHNEQFSIPAATGLILNGVYIVFLLFFHSSFGIEGLMVTTLISYLAQLIILLPLVYKTGYSYKITLNIRDKYVKKTLYLTRPVILGSMVYQINTIIDRTLASRLEDGSVSSLNYALTLNWLVISIFITAITTVIYPILSKEVNNPEDDNFKKIVEFGINIVLLITVPVTMGVIILAYPIVQVFFERGAFDSNATHMTVIALIYFSLGLPGIGLRELLSKVFYSIQDTKTPMVNAVIGILLNIVLNTILVKYMALGGLALATSVSSIVTTILLLLSLKKRGKIINLRKILTYLIKIFAATGIMGSILYYLNPHFLVNVNSLLIKITVLFMYIFLGAIVYIISCSFLKVKEIKVIERMLIQRIKR